MTNADASFARRVLIVLILLGAAALVCYTAKLLLLIFAGVLGAILINAAVEWVSRKTHRSYGASFLIVLSGAIAVFGAACWLLVPRVIVQLSQLGSAIPAGVRHLQAWLNATAAGRVLAAHSSIIVSGIAAKASTFGFDAIDALVGLAVAVVLSAYLAATPEDYEEGLLHLIPPAYRRRVSSVFRDVARTMGWWMLGQLIPMTVLGFVTMIGLLIIRIPLIFTLSLFTGVMIFIPFVGAIIAFIVTALVTISSDPHKVPLVAIVFVVIHVLEGYVLTPLVQKRAVHLPPALTIFSQVLMTALFGFTGLVLATPAAAGSLVLVKRIYLEEPVESPRL